jgi:hypothetical protein
MQIMFVMLLAAIAGVLWIALLGAIAFKLVIIDGKKPAFWPGWKKYLRQLPSYLRVGNDAPKGFHEIFWWWELRRLPYNLLLGSLGIVANLPLLAITKMSANQPFSESLIGFGLLCMVYAIGANICFSAGWIVETFFQKQKDAIKPAFGRGLYKIGLYFSAFLTIAIPMGILILILLLEIF